MNKIKQMSVFFIFHISFYMFAQNSFKVFMISTKVNNSTLNNVLGLLFTKY